MIDHSAVPLSVTYPGRPSWSAVTRSLDYRGPERRSGAALMARLMVLALDEIDYGLVVVGDDSTVLHANHAAKVELDGQHPLQFDGRQLRARDGRDQVQLNEALHGAGRRGLRRLLSLGDGSARAVVSVVPLPAGESGSSATLLVLGKSQVCGALSVQGYARAHKLSPGEEQVLAALCQGDSPADIAKNNGVAISTVRTQIANIRAKTGTDSIRSLIHEVAVLPPLVGALRHSAESRPAGDSPLADVTALLGALGVRG